MDSQAEYGIEVIQAPQHKLRFLFDSYKRYIYKRYSHISRKIRSPQFPYQLKDRIAPLAIDASQFF